MSTQALNEDRHVTLTLSILAMFMLSMCLNSWLFFSHQAYVDQQAREHAALPSTLLCLDGTGQVVRGDVPFKECRRVQYHPH